MKDAKARVTSIALKNKKLADSYAAAMKKYAAAKAARDQALELQRRDDLAYASAMANYAIAVQKADASNRGFGAQYSQQKAEWDQAKAQYDSALYQRLQILGQQKTQSDAALKNVTPPTGYAGCLSQADWDKYAAKCNATPNVTVKGIGSLFGLSGGDSVECLWTKLPVCASLPPLPPNPGAAPKKPTPIKVPVPAKPKARAIPKEPVKPTPPKLAEIPNIVIRDDAPPLAPEHPKSLAVAGLLAAVIVGGGAAYYLSTRKKKVA